MDGSVRFLAFSNKKGHFLKVTDKFQHSDHLRTFWMDLAPKYIKYDLVTDIGMKYQTNLPSALYEKKEPTKYLKHAFSLKQVDWRQ